MQILMDLWTGEKIYHQGILTFLSIWGFWKLESDSSF